MKRTNQLHITADKREIKDFPKLTLATSLIHKTLYAMPCFKDIKEE